MIAIMLAWPRLVPTAQADQGPSFVLPRSIVLLLATIAAIAFLIEGAMLDWAALLVVGAGLAPKTQGGLAYVLFSIAMTVGRLAGDAVVERAGDRATLMFGSLLALAGFGALLAAPVAVIAMIGLLLIGLGLSNVAPILFRRAGTQEAMPVGSGDCRDHDDWLCRNSHRTGWYGVPGQVRGTAGRIWGPSRAHVPRPALGADRDSEHTVNAFET
ncbi:MFS family permease [Bradyrhizobium sp. LM6.10]